jgi:uncharacterized membrane protein YgdD (TMEM256/DUF423 family)
MSPSFWLRIGAIWGFLAIAMGAFGAHGLEDRFTAVGDLTGKMTPDRLKANFQTAAQYQMYCALAILVVGILAVHGRGGAGLQVAGWLFLVGSLIFSGCLYALAVTGLRWLGAIVPIGGLAMLGAWVALAVAAGSFASTAKQ